MKLVTLWEVSKPTSLTASGEKRFNDLHTLNIRSVLAAAVAVAAAPGGGGGGGGSEVV